MPSKPTLNRKLVKISAHETMLNVSKELRPHLIIVTTPELRIITLKTEFNQICIFLVTVNLRVSLIIMICAVD